jgi:hypothetical protein
MEKEANLPPEIYHSHLMWFKIITLTTQTDVDEGPITRDGRVPQTQTIRQERQAPSTCQINIRQQALAFGREENWVSCVFHYKQRNKNVHKQKCPERNIGLYVTPCFKVYHIQLHF